MTTIGRFRWGVLIAGIVVAGMPMAAMLDGTASAAPPGTTVPITPPTTQNPCSAGDPLLIDPAHGRPGDLVGIEGELYPSNVYVSVYFGADHWFDSEFNAVGDFSALRPAPDVAPGSYQVALYLKAGGEFCAATTFVVDPPPPTTTSTTTTTTTTATTTTTTTTVPPTTTAPTTTVAPTTSAESTTTTAADTTTRAPTTTVPATTSTSAVTGATPTSTATTERTSTTIVNPTTAVVTSTDPTTTEPVGESDPPTSTLVAAEVSDAGSGILLPVILAFMGGVAAVLLVGLGWWIARRRYAGSGPGQSGGE
jgi:hypothetical protein